jgi:magnesium-transporting ATPase (P-type)
MLVAWRFKLFNYYSSSSSCSFILGQNGELEDFSARSQLEVTKNVIEPMASDALRTIGVAYKDFVYKKTHPNEVEIDGGVNWDDESSIQMGLTAIAILGIEDPVCHKITYILFPTTYHL